MSIRLYKLKAIVLVLLILALITPIFVFAAPKAGVAPDSPFYFFDRFFERVDLFFTFNSERKVQKNLSYADERLAEAEEMAVQKKPKIVEDTIAAYQDSVDAAIGNAKEVKEKKKTEEVLNIISDNTSKHEKVLRGVLAKVPDEAKPAIEKAIEVSTRKHAQALEEIEALRRELGELKGEVKELQQEIKELREEKQKAGEMTLPSSETTAETKKQPPRPTLKTSPPPQVSPTSTPPSPTPTPSPRTECPPGQIWYEPKEVCVSTPPPASTAPPPTPSQPCIGTTTQEQVECLQKQLQQLNQQVSPQTTPVSPPTITPPQEKYEYHSYYPIILSLEDNRGNVVKRSDYNKYQGVIEYSTSQTKTTLKIGDELILKVTTKDPLARSLLYNWTSNSQRFNQLIGLEGGAYKWITDSEIKYTITTEDIKTAGEKLRIVINIKSEKEYLRFPSGTYDDTTYIDYTLAP